MSRRVVSEQIIREFFSNPPINRSLFPDSIRKTNFAPLTGSEMEKLGKLAGLEVAHRDESFRRSVASVLDFCSSVDSNNNKKEVNLKTTKNTFPTLQQEEDRELLEQQEEQVKGGNSSEVILKNAKKTQEGFFIAPPTKAQM
jgi:Asp-tRNA(Asn)/Glu-tRNA(Gln) amidotransferase C subunit